MITDFERKLARWSFGGATGAALVIITQLATKSSLSDHERGAVFHLASALPLLVGGILVTFTHPKTPYARLSCLLLIVMSCFGDVLFAWGMIEFLLTFSLLTAVFFSTGAILIVFTFAGARRDDR